MAAGVPTWIVVEYQECFGQLLDACLYGQMVLDGKNAVLLDLRRVRRDENTNIGRGVVSG